MKRNVAIGTGLLALLVALGLTQSVLQRTAAAQAKGTVQAPRFEVDPMWPKPLPNHWVYGNVIGVGVDTKDHIYIIHRGAGSLEAKEIYAAANPPQSECCVPAPPVVEFDAEGNFVRAWGGPGQGFQWPESNHGITPDSKGNLFIGGNGGPDGHILKFTVDGKFVKQFGFAYASAGSNDMFAFNKVAKVSLDEKANEAYVADGYGNHRVAVIDMDTGKIKRYWGAYGNKPDDTPLGNYNPEAPLAQQFRNPVHCAEPSNDGNVYVCDRPNDRIQVFTKDGKFVKETQVAKNDARRRIGVGHRVLEGPGAEVFLSGRRRQREDSRLRSCLADRAHQLRRRRPSAGAVLRRAQHRHRLEGQRLHDRDVPRTAFAKVCLQGSRTRDQAQSGHGMADEDEHSLNAPLVRAKG